MSQSVCEYHLSNYSETERFKWLSKHFNTRCIFFITTK